MNLRNPRDIGLLIREERLRQGLDQERLAAKVGVSRQWLIGVERGKAGASIGLVLRTLNALGLRIHTGEPEARRTPPTAFPETHVDIDSVVEGARRKKP